MSPAAAPTTEQGSATGAGNSLPGSLGGALTWANLAGGDELEHVPQLQWPLSITAYRRMLNDAQCQGLYLGLTLPIRSLDYRIDPNGARDEIVNKVQEDTNLDLIGEDPQPRRRGQRRFSFPKHLEDACRMIVYGHYGFEQVGEIDADDKWRLRKLAPRPPYTISEIAVERDGGLKHIRQATGPNDPPITVDRLVWYAWDREGANWIGRSMFRSSYGPWLIKDRILRVGAINIERAGGVPYVEGAPGMSADELEALDRLAQNFKVSEGGGAALPHGAQLKLAQAAGGKDAVDYINLMNEEMARSFLLMVMMLGQTQTGSRALGGTFQDSATLVQNTIAKSILDVFNEHVIEDWVVWNYGEEEEYAPLIVIEGGDAVDPLEGFREQAQEGNLKVDDPETAEQLGINASARRTVAGRSRRRARAAADASPVSLPSRPLRRQPYPQEVNAAVDWSAMDSDWQMTRDNLVATYTRLRAVQITELHDAIIEAGGDLSKLTRIAATPVAIAEIAGAMSEVAERGVNDVVNEALRQGREVPRPDVDDLHAALNQRAEAVSALLARDLSDAAVRHSVRLTGGSLSASEVAAQVEGHLSTLSNAYLDERLGGAVTAAQNAGRKLVMNRDGEPGTIYASELLDTATCSPCIAKDGTSYPDMATAEQDYPTGGFKDCDGYERCRGTLVKVYGEAV